MSMGGWAIDDQGVRTLCNAAIENKGIESLILTRNNFGVPGIDAIRDLLSHQTALRNLTLMGNRIDDTMVSALFEPLASEHSLEDLELCDNRIGEEGHLSIAQALRQNTSLLRLTLASINSGITNTGARKIIESVKVHPKITSVYLYGFECSSSVFKELDFHLELNKTKSLLQADPSPSLWPRVFERVDSGRYRREFGLSMLNLFVRRKLIC